MMTRIGRYIGIILLALTLAACGKGKAGRVETPSGIKMQRGRNYREVIEDFEDKGFTNIRVEKIEDLKYGWVVRNGEVEEISVGGDTNYDPGVWVPADTEVVIRYHTYDTKDPEGPETEESAEAGTKESTEAGTKESAEAGTKESAEAGPEKNAPAGTEVNTQAGPKESTGEKPEEKPEEKQEEKKPASESSTQN